MIEKRPNMLIDSRLVPVRELMVKNLWEKMKACLFFNGIIDITGSYIENSLLTPIHLDVLNQGVRFASHIAVGKIDFMPDLSVRSIIDLNKLEVLVFYGVGVPKLYVDEQSEVLFMLFSETGSVRKIGVGLNQIPSRKPAAEYSLTISCWGRQRVDKNLYTKCV